MTAISNAAVAVATAEGHGLEEGQIVKLVSGWSAINGRAAKVGAVTDDTFQLLGFDTSDEQRYPSGGGAGSVRRVMGWQQIQQVMNPSTAGGEQQYTQYQFLEDDDQRQLPTVRSAQSISIPIAEGFVCYRLCESAEPAEKDFLSHRKLFPNKVFNAPECRARAISVFKQPEDLDPFLKLPIHKHKAKVKITLRGDDGLAMKTGKASHYSWWRSKGFSIPTVAEGNL